MSGDDLWECVKDLPKATDGPEALNLVKKAKSGWSKKSIFWDLPYWKHLLLCHNLDVMHIEKNVCDSIIRTLLTMSGTKDGLKAWEDMQYEKVRPTYGRSTMNVRAKHICRMLDTSCPERRKGPSVNASMGSRCLLRTL